MVDSDLNQNATSCYNEDELNPPDWMSNQFFEKVIKNYENNNVVQILQLRITPGTGKNDHYASVMFRVSILYKVGLAKVAKNKSLIVKTIPFVEGQKKDMVSDMFVFETEIGMYSETLPLIEGILRKHGDSTVLSAKILYYSLHPQKCIVFEDLCEKGFETIRRVATLEEAKVALLKLAKLHAVSYKLGKEKNNQKVTTYSHGTFTSKNFCEMELTTGAFSRFRDEINEYDDLKPFVPYVEAIGKDIVKKCQDSCNAYRVEKPEGIFVLNHGDFHIKNMMFKWIRPDELDDIMLLDYQMSFFGPAVLDVMYATIMLMSREVRMNHQSELIYYYFKNFQNTLKKIGYQDKIPSMAEFQVDWLRHRHYELFLAIAFLPLTPVLTDVDGDISKLVESEDNRRKMLKSSTFIDEMRILLPKYLYMGYFE